MYKSTTQIRVRYAETDQMNVVYYGNYAQYFEVGRVEAIRQLGYSYKEMEDDGIILPVVELHTRYLRSAAYDDLLTIITTIKDLPVAHEIVFHSEIFNENNKLLTTGEVHLFFLNKETKKRTIMPEKMLNKLKPYFE
ncbi:thioesterase [Arachidicoccus ginsenosidimutans]|uniref:acyl-CoA thioesterase n=1 Tax=Arachidicoccus sp. BS20 TaxID=1850526 RepID=UPI0007F08C12|nr:thioesterase family protein [Arachidicoccus sp. BS20]ANI89527.1 thioesterase [Arachidicoccus sp. BS20]